MERFCHIPVIQGNKKKFKIQRDTTFQDLENAPEREMIGITAEKVRYLRHLMHLFPSRGQTFFEEYLSKVLVKKKLQKK